MELLSTFYDCNFNDTSTLLGSGSYSKVYRCQRKADKQTYAVKVIHFARLSAHEQKLLGKEVEICKALDHPNIVKLKDVFIGPSHHYLVFDLVQGGELFDEIVRRESYSEKDASICIKMLLVALEHCHANHVMHRDLKPENLLLSDSSKDATLKLVDFGSALFFEEGKLHPGGRTGTPAYFSPEVVAGNPYGPKVDVWGAGVILYILLGGYPPFPHDVPIPTLYGLIKDGLYEFHSPEWDDVSADAKDLISKMLTVDATARITVADALEHPWIKKYELLSDQHRENALAKLRKFNARRKLKGAIGAVMAAGGLFKRRRVSSTKEEAGAAAGDEDTAAAPAASDAAVAAAAEDAAVAAADTEAGSESTAATATSSDTGGTKRKRDAD